ncbi:hypothetical protein [Bradymonas sediminis]|uniref:Uncharacterized protein n=1 Tax=Bradymonas sediminis TaxID=1548548 RepID=A0A2Z4FN43_9DELT|nr:hypothetical protein [Bradymonas sediminis]AWV90352.1 hypothetical protein DN745_13835 [Bradymonas sediminis]TDP75671.1 hypothetical protein DFR33_10310 [Bradymonas sediminis]
MTLPRGLRVSDIHALLIAVFFPARTPASLQAELDSGAAVKMAIVFERDGQVYRALRRGELSSLRLQTKQGGGFQTLASGAAEVQQRLAETAGPPSFETFVALNLWGFDDEHLFQPPAESIDEDKRLRSLIEQYKVALQVEEIDHRIQTLEVEIAEQRSALGMGAKIEEKLEQARAKLDELRVSGLAEEEIALLRQKEERLAEFEQLLERLLGEEEVERRDIEEKLPQKPWRVGIFWAGIAIGIVSLGASIALGGAWRPIAALNIVGFGMVAWVLLKYFTGMERAGVHQARLESIKRRMNQVRDDDLSFREKVNHMLIHARVDDEDELLQRVEKSEQLKVIVAQLEAKAAEVRRNPAHKRAKAELDGLRAELEERVNERANLPSDVISSYQMEEDLRSLGVQPEAALRDEPAQAAEMPTTSFGRLILAAQNTGQYVDGKLDERVRKMWGKICGHVLNDRFKGVDLGEDGELAIAEMSPEQLGMWRRTRSSEERIVGAALALALHVSAAERSAGFIETIWVRDPRDDFGVNAAAAFDDVFASAAKKSHIILCS